MITDSPIAFQPRDPSVHAPHSFISLWRLPAPTLSRATSRSFCTDRLYAFAAADSIFRHFAL